MVGAASNIAAALVIRACLSGDLPLPFWQSISSTLLYFVLGQVCLTLSSVVLQVRHAALRHAAARWKCRTDAHAARAGHHALR